MSDPTTPRPPSLANLSLAAREQEWRRRLGAATLAWLIVETLTGLAIWLLPFSASAQWTVVVHTAIGLLVLLPALWYLGRHLAVYWSRPRTAVKYMGYLGALAMLVAVVTGVVLTAQALFGRRIGYGWDLAHLASTLALAAFALPHVGIVLWRDRSLTDAAGGRPLRAVAGLAMARTLGWTAAMAAPIALLAALLPGEHLERRFPDDYSWKYGKDRPFAPSLARTQTGGAIDPRVLSGSESCGTAGCHEQIVAEWKVSAHRWAAMDAGFQKIQSEMGKQNGPESTRYCGGCHDPISLFSGTKNLFVDNLTDLAGYQEGVSCLVCHSVRKTDVEGNANYVMAEPSRYLFETRPDGLRRVARDFLLRAYPRQHVADLSKRLFKTPEYCAACHKQFIDQEVNNVGWVQLQNQYDNWRKSRWNHPGDPRKTIECRECHMPLQASLDPSAGDVVDYNRTPTDGRTRSHRFLASNQFMPAVLKLEGADEQVRLTEQWLRGEYPIPEIADKWMAGPVVGLELDLPSRVAPGDQVALRAVITSNKVGHDFPTGPLDIIQSWVQLSVTDEAGSVLFATGGVDERHFIQPGSFLFKAEPVDQYGNLIDRHNLWEMVGVRYRRSLFPGFSDTAEFAFKCPGTADATAVPDKAEKEFRFEAPAAPSGHLRVTARLLYRKVDQYLLNFMFGEESGLTAPVTEMARVEKTIELGPPPGVPGDRAPVPTAAR